MIDRVSDIDVDSSDPGKAIEEIYQIDRDIFFHGALNDVLENSKVNGSIAHTLRMAMNNKLSEATQQKLAGLKSDLMISAPENIASTSVNDLKDAYYNILLATMMHTEDHDHSEMIDEVHYEHFSNDLVDRFVEIENELERREGLPFDIFAAVKQEVAAVNQKNCISKIADIGVADRHLNEKVVSINRDETMGSAFCGFANGLSLYSKFYGEFDHSGNEYKVTLMEKGSGGVGFVLAKNDNGAWFGREMISFNADGEKIQSKSISEIEWQASLAGLHKYWSKFK